jgi:hypothetical protein
MSVRHEVVVDVSEHLVRRREEDVSV